MKEQQRYIVILVLLFYTCSHVEPIIYPDLVYNFIRIVYPNTSREGLIYKYINKERTRVGIKELESDKFITSLSIIRAKVMDINNNISHDGVYKEFLKLRNNGSNGEGEILASGFSTARGSINGWMKSSKHKTAILNSTYDYIGVGCILDTTFSKSIWIDVVIFVNEKTINN